ncbi:MAG: hypothetical protein JXK50_07080 [Campylobacterales bacterium]|nr:hypothetical protein [Campylobacterales bacterium]
MFSNIIKHTQLEDSSYYETKLSIKSKNIPTLDEFKTILEYYGYSLSTDLYLEIKFLLPVSAQIGPLLKLIKALQINISKHTTCMFKFVMSHNKNCITKIF